MDWSQVLFLFFANAGLIIWFRAESRADERRALDMIEAIKDEMRDFHGRMCALEAKKHNQGG